MLIRRCVCVFAHGSLALVRVWVDCPGQLARGGGSERLRPPGGNVPGGNAYLIETTTNTNCIWSALKTQLTECFNKQQSHTHTHTHSGHLSPGTGRNRGHRGTSLSSVFPVNPPVRFHFPPSCITIETLAHLPRCDSALCVCVCVRVCMRVCVLILDLTGSMRIDSLSKQSRTHAHTHTDQ